LRHAEVRERLRVSGFVDDLSERGAVVAELAVLEGSASGANSSSWKRRGKPSVEPDSLL
jgi:hypothetical protein